ncbi:MAG: alpha/beta hydrolase, partial [Leptospiraceae bacterium]|nr:alpha/beta hydrolase [Leptospiraceae bacterium]
MAYIRTIVRIIACCVLFGGCALLQPYGQSDTVQRIENVEYSQIHTRNRMDLFLPVGQDQYPTVVFVHGGWWRNQSKTYWRPFTGLYWNVGLALARQGIATAIIDYRIYPEGQIREQLNDVRRSIAWVQHNIHAYGGNPQAVFVAGHSAGGHLALLAGCDPDSDLRGVIALSPVLDLEYLFAHESAEFQDEVLYPVFGTDRELWRAYDPVQKLNSA